MKKQSYTPGPWILNYTLKNPMREQHDRVRGVCSLDLHPGGITEANARLIAAAPEMLELLRECLSHVGDIPRLKHAVEDCIAKARGES